MARLLKEVDYYNLVVLLYKTSGLNLELLEYLFYYVVGALSDNNFNRCYVDKLKVDLNIFVVKSYNKSVLELKLSDLLGGRAFTMFRGALFDVLTCGYYG